MHSFERFKLTTSSAATRLPNVLSVVSACFFSSLNIDLIFLLFLPAMAEEMFSRAVYCEQLPDNFQRSFLHISPVFGSYEVFFCDKGQ
jgi:hypothetical protein